MDKGFPHELLDDIQPLGPVHLADAYLPDPSESPRRGQAHEIDAGYKQNNEGDQKKNVYMFDFLLAPIVIDGTLFVVMFVPPVEVTSNPFIYIL